MKKEMDKSLKLSMIAFTVVNIIATLMLIGSVYLIIKLFA